MLELKNNYLAVTDGCCTGYGGSQMHSASKNIRKCGCGPVAALDLLLYLNHFHGCHASELDRIFDGTAIDDKTYHEYLSKLTHSYFPLIPGMGMNGIQLMAGVNLMFLKYKMPFYARWGVMAKNTWPAIEEMLNNDIPVILAIGPNFPFFWQKHKASLYSKVNESGFARSAEVKAHFVTATGIDEDWIQIASWGRKYYLNKAEFRQYVKKYSLNYFSSILYVKKR